MYNKVEGNKLIAKFMGAVNSKVDDDSRYMRFKNSINGVYAFLPNELMYDKSWDWLMPVIEKINNDYEISIIIHFDKNTGGKLYHCYIDKILEQKSKNDFPQVSRIVGMVDIESSIMNTWETVVRFIRINNKDLVGA